MKKDYELINHGEFGVIAKKQYGTSSYYPYNPIYTLIEVDVDFNHSTLKIESFHGKEEWTYRLLRNENDSLANWQSRENAINYVGEKAIIEAEKQVRKNIVQMKKDLKVAKVNPVFLQMKVIADENIGHYKSDFEYWDCLTLYRETPKKFLWLVRNTGTWLITMKSDSARGILKYERENHESNKYYWYNGIKLKEISLDDTFELYDNLPNFKSSN